MDINITMESGHPPLTDIKKIGVFRALQLGDTLCAIPAIRALRNAFPQAEIVLIGMASQQKIVDRFNHYFDGLIEFPGWPGLPEQKVEPHKVTDFLRKVQSEKFDLIIQMHGNGTFINPMCELFGGRYTAGLRLRGGYCPDDRLFPIITEEEHEVTRFAKVVQALGIRCDDLSLEFPVSEDEKKNFLQLRNKLGLTDKKYICIHPGARDPRRRWPPERFAWIADVLVTYGYTIVITGSGEESEITERVSKSMHLPSINLVEKAGHVGLGELSLLIGEAAVLLTNDTGVSHIAAAMKTPSVIVFSQYSEPKRWAPLDGNLHIPVEPHQASDSYYVLNALWKHLSKVEQAQVA